MDHVDLFANGVKVATTEVYPFQFRYTPPASAVGCPVVLTARAVDAAGNVSYASMGVNVVGGPRAGRVAHRRRASRRSTGRRSSARR